MNEEFGDLVASKVMKKYNSLSKKGKPTEKEWSVLAAFVLSASDGRVEVVSLGTGSKCLGRDLLSKKGDLVNDSHAEIIARRAFVRYVYTALEAFLDQRSKKEDPDKKTKQKDEHLQLIKDVKAGKFVLQEDVKVHLYVSQTPCGDASIFPLSSEEIGEVSTVAGLDRDIQPRRKKVKPNKEDSSLDQYEESGGEDDSSQDDVVVKKGKRKLEDIQRTGAKSVVGEQQDPKLPGQNYHATGVLRTKPGAGNPTSSMSCSDKIARWTTLGVQGSLLMYFLQKPIYLDSLIIGEKFHLASLKRALIDRLDPLHITTLKDLPEGYEVRKPALYHTKHIFPKSKSQIEALYPGQSNPSGCAINFSESPSPLLLSIHEVTQSASGTKQGARKRDKENPKLWPQICKKSLLLRFVQLYQKLNTSPSSSSSSSSSSSCSSSPSSTSPSPHGLEIPTSPTKDETTYFAWKQGSKEYQAAKRQLLQGPFKHWMTTPPEYESFS